MMHGYYADYVSILMLIQMLWYQKQQHSHSIPSSSQSTKLLHSGHTLVSLSISVLGPGFNWISPDIRSNNVVNVDTLAGLLLFSIKQPYLLNRLTPLGLVEEITKCKYTVKFGDSLSKLKFDPGFIILKFKSWKKKVLIGMTFVNRPISFAFVWYWNGIFK